MKSEYKHVISASRRTDIPAFYLKWFMRGIDRGYFEVINPFNGQKRVIPSKPKDVHTIVFWSKDFGPFIDSHSDERLKKMGYHLFFNFTINSENAILEPHVPALRDRLRQLEYLVQNHDPRAVQWRFDPVCFYREEETGDLKNNLDQFSRIASEASKAGVRKCVTSFMDHYPKISRRIKKIPGFSFVNPSADKKRQVLLGLKNRLAPLGIKLYACCEKGLLKTLPPDSDISGSSCIPNDILQDIYGGRISIAKDTGQRVKNGCGCMVSADIGSYSLHPCEHRCLFCYANPSSGVHAQKQYSIER